MIDKLTLYDYELSNSGWIRKRFFPNSIIKKVEKKYKKYRKFKEEEVKKILKKYSFLIKSRI